MNTELIYPFLSMIALTFVLMPITSYARIRAVYSGRLRTKHFKLMTFSDEDPFVTKTTRHFNNLFEMPVVFYALILLALHLEMSSPVLTYAAWSFVFFRLVHAIIHITYNKVLHRLVSFVLSCLSLFIFLSTLVFYILK